MNKYEKGVPFDPGYADHYTDFYLAVAPFTQEMSKIKAMHQKKFRLSILQAELINLLRKSTGFYLGCLLWAAYISNRFKDSPKEIIGNHNLEDKTDLEESNIVEYLDQKFEFIKKLDKDYQYFLKKPLITDTKIYSILEAYKEFAIVNNNFINTKLTSEVKLPEKLNYFSEFSHQELDEMEQKIFEIIKSGNLDLLLDAGFYRL